MRIKYILFIVCLIGIYSLNFVSAYSSNSLINYCYQESANQSNSADGSCNLNYTGYYTKSSISSTSGYLYINYSKPTANVSNVTLRISHGNFGERNISIYDCLANDLIRLRIFSQSVGNGLSQSYGECYNGINWTIITEIASVNPCTSFSCSGGGYTNGFDGNWSTSTTWCSSNFNSGSYCSGVSSIFEEGIYWDIIEIRNENLTFVSNSNITRYFKVPSNTILTNAYLNLSGFNYTHYCYQESANVTNQIGIDGNCSLTYTGKYAGNIGVLNDGMLTTGSNVGNLWINYTKPIGVTNKSQWMLRLANLATNYTTIINLTTDCFTQINLQLKENLTASMIETEIREFYCFNGTHWKEQYTTGWIESSTNYLYEEAIIWNVSTPVYNPSLFINTNQAWNYLGYLIQSNNKTNNFASLINSYLSSCTYLSGFCLVPFIFHSDSGGILQYSDLIFNNNGLLENSQTFNLTTYETSLENFNLNLTYDSNFYNVATAVLNYNGTSYSASISGSNGNYIASKSLDINLANVDGEKREVYWTVSLTNSTATYLFNSTFYNQTVYLINFSNNSALGIKTLNFTAYNQNTLSRIASWNFKGTFNYFLGSGVYYRNLSISNLNIAEQSFFIRNNTNYKLTGTIQFSADNYATADYNFLNTVINNITQNISLYLLNLSSTTSFIIKVQDNNQNPLPNYLVYIYRYDSGLANPYLVQVSKTDSAGKTVGFFETETVDYKFVIVNNNGSVVYTSERRKIIPETTPYTLIFTIGYIVPSPISYYNNLTGIVYDISYNKNNYIATYVYTDSNSSFTSSNLVIKFLNASGLDDLICNTSSSNPSGVLTCNLSGNLSGTYSAVAYVYRGNQYMVDNLIFNIDTTSQIFGMIGLLIGFFIILICAFAFAYNEVAGIIMVNIGIIFTQIIGLINFGWIFIFSIIGASILILIVLERG